MLRTSARRARASLAAAVVAGLVGTGAAALSAPASAAPAGPRLASGVHVGKNDLTALAKKSGKGAEPRVVSAPKGVPSRGKYGFLLKLDTTATRTAYNSARTTRSVAAAKSVARAQLARVTNAQDAVIAALPQGSAVLYRTHAVLAGVSVYTDVKNYAALTRLRGVSAVYPIAPKTRSNSYAVPLQKAPQAWTAHSNEGAKSTIAVIDTGLDYTHADFGGPGTKTAYNAANAADTKAPAAGSFDPNKYAGGYDLVGDAYNPGDDKDSVNKPTPDPNPLDCTDDVGHGTHVAGTAAGYGENADGSTYTGAYNTSTPFQTMKIGPGMAPLAKIYSLRVFGCVGSTDVVGAAIDRAVDPDQNGDPSDAVDVINMSLGGDYGNPDDGDSVLADAAAAAGVNVIVAAGNAGDTYDIGGSPGNAPRVVAVAASEDAQDFVDGVEVKIGSADPVTYGQTRSLAYDWATKPDLTGDVIAPLADKTGCAAFSTADKARLAGKIAFLEWNAANVEAGTECGSVARGTNAKDAGAVGFVFADTVEDFGNNAITGVDSIPGVLVTKSGGDAIRAALAANTTVHVVRTTTNSVKQTFPELDDQVAEFSSRSERAAGDLKPDVTAVGYTVFSAHVGTGNDGESISGTSMATPMTAGLAALVDTAHKTWTAEQVKADIMNTADQDLYTGPNHTGTKYAPNRVGAGRIDAAAALNNSVLAYVKNDPGAVSVSFGPVAVAGTSPVLKTKTVTVQNTGASAATYSVAYDALTKVPGATYAISPSTVTVPANGSTQLTVTLTLDPTKLTKTIDPTVDPEQLGNPREFLADASGRIKLTGTGASSGAPALRVPVYSAPRPASSMSQPASLTLPNGSVQKALLPLKGHQVDQGSGATKVASLVAGFELAATSGLAPRCSSKVTQGCVLTNSERRADLKYVGVTSDAPTVAANGQNPADDGSLYFAITTQAAWTTAVGREEFDILLDTDRDGVPDFVTFNTSIPNGEDGTDVQVAETIDLASGDIVDAQGLDGRLGDTDAALFDSDSMVLPVSLGALGLFGSKRIDYAVMSFSNVQDAPIDELGTTALGDVSGALSTNPFRPGVTVAGSYGGDASPLVFRDTPSAVLALRRDSVTYLADKGQGALLIHFHNLVGSKAQRVALRSESKPKFSFAPSTVKKGRTTTVTVTVPATGKALASGVVRLVRLSGPKAPIVSISGKVTNGKATLKYPTGGLKPGLYKYQVSYGGDANYLPSKSNGRFLRVTK